MRFDRALRTATRPYSIFSAVVGSGGVCFSPLEKHSMNRNFLDKNCDNQLRMKRFAQHVARMPQAKNFYLSFLYRHRTFAPLHLGLTFLLLIGLLSCGNLSRFGMNAIGVNITPIRELKPPQDDNNATVYIQGKVERQVSLIQRQAYQINDSTGKIWVITNQNLQEGDDVVIKGQIRYQSIPLAGKEYGEVYLEEE